MFKAVLDGNIVKEVLESVTAVVEEAKLVITDQNMAVNAVDPANVALVRFELTKKAFVKYEFEPSPVLPYDKPVIEVGIGFGKLDSVIAPLCTGLVNLTIDEIHKKLVIRVQNYTYTIDLLDPTTLRKEPRIPDLDFTGELELKTEDFIQAIRAADKLGQEAIELGIDSSTEEFYVKTGGDETETELVFTLHKSQCKYLVPVATRSHYSLEYLKEFIKGLSHAEYVILRLSNNYPLKVEFMIADEAGTVTYLLAPRIE